jgi:hypothetical protein
MVVLSEIFAAFDDSKEKRPEVPEQSFLKCPSSRVDIGCVGYAKGSPVGNMMGIRSGRCEAVSNGWDRFGCGCFCCCVFGNTENGKDEKWLVPSAVSVTDLVKNGSTEPNSKVRSVIQDCERESFDWLSSTLVGISSDSADIMKEVAGVRRGDVCARCRGSKASDGFCLLRLAGNGSEICVLPILSWTYWKRCLRKSF